VIFAGPSSTFSCSSNNFATALTGTLGVRILSATGATIKSRTTSGIVEAVATSGFYIATINLGALPAAPTPGHYYVFWDNGAVTPGNTASEDLYISGTSSLSAALRSIQAVANSTGSGDNFTVGIFVP
jgi:hypothetical protein